MVARLLKAQVKELTPKKRCTSQRRDNRSSNNGVDVWMTQQQSQQRWTSSTTGPAGSRVAPSNPVATRLTLSVHPVRQQTDPGDQIALSSLEIY